jgi:hypothetical protein
MSTLLLLDYNSRLIGERPERPALMNPSVTPPPAQLPFEPTSRAGTDRAEVEALGAEVKALAASVAALGAGVVAGDAELREVEMRIADLETALEEARDRELVAFELLSMADIAVDNRLNGPKFVEVTDRFAQQGGELAGLTRSVAVEVKRLLAEGGDIGAEAVAGALRAQAKRLLDPRSNRSRRQRG